LLNFPKKKEIFQILYSIKSSLPFTNMFTTNTI
jgi:hypothetical protein